MSNAFKELRAEVERLKARLASLETGNYAGAAMTRKMDQQARDRVAKANVEWVWTTIPLGQTYGGSSSVDHGLLSGLADDDHTQYLLIDGTRAMSGDLDMGGNDINNVGDIPGVVMEADYDANTILAATADNTPAPLTVDLNTLVGRLSGAIDSLTPTEVRGLINVEDGATADLTAAEILALLLTVDGAGSGLDADLLDGIQESLFFYVTGARSMTGGLNMGTNAISAVTTIYLASAVKTADYTATASDHAIYVDTSAGDVTITLPTGVANKEYEVKKFTGSGVCYVVGTGQSFDRGSQIEMSDYQHTVTVKFDSTGTKWRLIHESIWTTPPSMEFMVIQTHESGDSISSDVYFPFAASELLSQTNINRVQSVAPVAGTIHSLYVQVASSLSAGETWVVTLYKNEVATALTVTLSEGEAFESDTTNRVDVVAGDLLQWYFDVTGGASDSFQFSCVYEASSQPMFAFGERVGSGGTIYSMIGPSASFSSAEDAASVFPCAGTLSGFYIDDPEMDASGEEVTYKIQSYNGATWDDELTITHNFLADGGPDKSDLVSTIDIAAGDILRARAENTGSGAQQFPSLSCIFTPDVAGQRVAMGCCDSYTEGDADTYAIFSGQGTDAGSSGIFAQSPIPANVTFGDLYVACAAAPGTSKWIEVELLKDGAATGLSARITDPALTGSETSTEVSYTKETHDIGINITNSGDTPAAQAWVAWGVVYT